MSFFVPLVFGLPPGIRLYWVLFVILISCLALLVCVWSFVTSLVGTYFLFGWFHLTWLVAPVLFVNLVSLESATSLGSPSSSHCPQGPVFPFFSVNGSGHFCGMAQMLNGVDYHSSAGVWAQDKWKGNNVVLV